MSCRGGAAAVLLLLLTGCTTPGTYLRSRGADLLDAIPFSVGFGWGLGISARATPLAQAGLAVAPITCRRYGYDDRVFCGAWSEYQTQIPWSFWNGDLGLVPPLPSEDNFWSAGGLPLFYRWQSMRDAPLGEGARDDWFEPNARSWGRHPPVTREICGGIVVPARTVYLEYFDLRRELRDQDVLVDMGAPELATLWETQRESRPAPRAWDLFELDVFVVFIGLRLGFRPVEAADFLVGIVGIDLLGDDLPDPVSWEPVEQELVVEASQVDVPTAEGGEIDATEVEVQEPLDVPSDVDPVLDGEVPTGETGNPASRAALFRWRGGTRQLAPRDG